jgi:hypothetical protein
VKRISKRVREEAALILACCASADRFDNEFGSTYQSMLGLDVGREPQSLAYKAWDYVTDHVGMRPIPTWETGKRYRYAEAEALLRTGWSP